MNVDVRRGTAVATNGSAVDRPSTSTSHVSVNDHVHVNEAAAAPAAALAPDVSLSARPPLSPGRRAGLTALTTVSLVGATALGGGAVALVHSAAFQATGRPDALRLSGELVVGVTLGVLVTQLLTPLSVLAVDEGVPGGVAAARAGGWRLSRWPLLGTALGVGLMAVGGALERGDFGSGQVWLVGGGGTLLASWIAYCITEAIGVADGYAQHRRAAGLP